MNYEIGLGSKIKMLAERESSSSSVYMRELVYCLNNKICFETERKFEVTHIYNMVLQEVVNLLKQEKSKDEIISDCIIVVCTIFDLSYNEAKIKINSDIMEMLISTMTSIEPIVESNRFIDNPHAYFEIMGDV